MQRKPVLTEVDKLLDEWDPLGVLQQFKPIDYSIDALGEYSNYVVPVIQTYLANRSVEDYLIQLQTDLRDYPNKEMKVEIKIVAEKLIALLAKYPKSDLAEFR